MIPHPKGVTSERMTDLALENLVAVRPGSEYGPSGEGFVRIAFCVSPSDVEEGLDRLGRAFSRVPGGGARPAIATRGVVA